ncbi:MAG: hypothetical protein IKR09_02225 [Alphaproteobacteria bacterium]|nr:hypothetical protein [Alphaproteobacteria bacterium]
MKRVLLLLGLLFWSESAVAVCSGGFDGADSTLLGCSEMGGLGDLVYKRDDNGRVLGKRSEAEIKSHLVSTVEERLKGRGVTMKDKNGKPSVTVNDDNIVFDLFNQNGDKVFTYTVDLEKGLPVNEKDIISSREAYDTKKAESVRERKDRIVRMQALADKIKAEEIDNKAAAKK